MARDYGPPGYHVWLWQALKDRGLIQKQMAEAVGFDESAASRFMNFGRPELTPHQVTQLYKLLNRKKKLPMELGYIMLRLTERPLPEPPPRRKPPTAADRRRQKGTTKSATKAIAHSTSKGHAQNTIDPDTSSAIEKLKDAIKAAQDELGPGFQVQVAINRDDGVLK